MSFLHSERTAVCTFTPALCRPAHILLLDLCLRDVSLTKQKDEEIGVQEVKSLKPQTLYLLLFAKEQMFSLTEPDHLLLSIKVCGLRTEKQLKEVKVGFTVSKRHQDSLEMLPVDQQELEDSQRWKRQRTFEMLKCFGLLTNQDLRLRKTDWRRCSCLQRDAPRTKHFRNIRMSLYFRTCSYDLFQSHGNSSIIIANSVRLTSRPFLWLDWKLPFLLHLHRDGKLL